MTFALVMVAGLALVAQNLLMTGAARDLGTLGALVVNSAVGLMLLGSLLLGQGGASALGLALRPWHLLPGLLGTFFVFASLTGYRTLGAAPTIALLVTSQLIGGLGVDVLRGGTIPTVSLIGGALLVVGCWLVLSARA